MAPKGSRRDGPPYGDWRDQTTGERSVDRPSRARTDVVGHRIVAQIVDLVVQFVQLLAVALLLAFLLQPRTESGVRAMVGRATLSLPLYGTILESRWRGQTIGKRVAGIAVVDGDGEHPSLRTAFVRNLPAVIVFSWATTAIALASIAMTERRQRLFDQVASTYVVEL